MTGSSPRSSTSRSSAPCNRRPTSTARRTSATVRRSTATFSTGSTSPTPSARSSSGSRSTGHGEGTVTYKLRDWLFSRQRYWGEPFPIVYDDVGPIALPESLLPVELPEIVDFEPATSDDPDALPEPPLARAADWVEVELDLPGPAWAGYGGGRRTYLRETNTMPQWAGSCWYYLRYLDPTNEDRLVDPAVEREWAQGTRADGSPKAGLVDLYVGGVEHAVLHLCTRASGTRCSTTSATCRRSSRSSGC